MSIRTDLWDGWALLSDGTVWCWTHRSTLFCGDSVTPRQLALPCARLMDASENYAVIVTTTDEVWLYGPFGDPEPIVLDGKGVSWVDVGEFAVAWGGEAGVWWWGDISWLPDSPLQPEPFPFPAERVFIGAGHICHLLEGTLSCFGLNSNGQLGDGTVAGVDEAILDPVVSRIPTRVITAQASAGRTSAIDVNGDYWTWGYERPFGEVEPSGPWPAIWEELPARCGFYRGDTAGCAWTCGGEVHCWGGSPLGLFKLDPFGGWEPPMRVPDLEPAAEISVDTDSPLCVRKIDGTVWCRGGYGAGGRSNEDGTAIQLLFAGAP